MNESRSFRALPVIITLVISLLTVGHTEEKKLRIAYSSPSLDFSWLAIAAKTAKDEAEKLNIELIVQDGQGSSPKQSSDLRNAVNQGVDGDYTGGTSETHLGEFIASTKEMDRYVVATKYTANMRPDDPNGGGNSRKSMVQSVEASLRRLQTDYIDLLWVHMWDSVTGS